MAGIVGDGSDMPGNTCSNCITFKYKCTYMEAATVRIDVWRVVRNDMADLNTICRRDNLTQGKDGLVRCMMRATGSPVPA